MSSIFSQDVFGGLGQTTAAEDAAFNSLISSLAVPTTTASAMAKSTASEIWSPASAPTAYPSPVPSTNNTAIYIVGGVVAVSALAVLFMMSGRRVKANRRRRSRR
jgi:hypothetical protein